MVTYDRLLILVDNYSIFWAAVESCRSKTDYEIIAWVLLPDYLHMIIEQSDNYDMSILVQRIKMSFAARYRKAKQLHAGRIWQHRFWDHIIRDQSDYNRHIDYIHYNPVKHGFVKRPFEWEYSSIHVFKDRGHYPDDWGVKPQDFDNTSFGE